MTERSCKEAGLTITHLAGDICFKTYKIVSSKLSEKGKVVPYMP
jgi:hypothetical protein